MWGESSILATIRKNMILVFWGFHCFTKLNGFQLHPFVFLQNLGFNYFLCINSVPLCVCTYFLYLAINQHLCWFHVIVIVKQTAINMNMKLFYKVILCIWKASEDREKRDKRIREIKPSARWSLGIKYTSLARITGTQILEQLHLAS